MLDISDKAEVSYMYHTFGWSKGLPNIDYIEMTIDASEFKGFKGFIKITQLKKLFRRLKSLSIFIESYSDNERFVRDTENENWYKEEEPIIWTTNVNIYFKEDLKEKKTH
jgi:hypothetical protein